MTKYNRNLKNVEAAFDRSALARVCAMDELDFGDVYNLDMYDVPEQSAPDNFYFFRDHGSRVLAVAHLDTVGLAHQRAAHFVDTEAGPVVYSRALDDRLGAYIILELLPALDIQYDVLLTVGEESGQSTAAFFDHPEGKVYDWLIEFDRGGTDVVMYQYDDEDTRRAVRQTGAVVGDGIFSDISYMEHLETKGFNWGVGYRDYHGPKAHAYLDDTFEMVARYLKFHQINEGTRFEHEEAPSWYGGSKRAMSSDRYWWDDERDHVNPEGELFDEDGYYRESTYFDEEYIEDPTAEQIQACMDAMDRDRAYWMERVEDRTRL